MQRKTVRGRMGHPGVQARGSDETAVYRLFDELDRLLYVGMGRNPLTRWAAHAERHSWWPDVASFQVDWFGTREEAADEERRVLREEAPVHNIHSTGRHGLATGEGVRRALGGRRNFTSRLPAVTPE